MSHQQFQDWEPVILKKSVKQKQTHTQIDPRVKKLIQLDNNTGENLKIDTILDIDRKLITSLRISKGLSQDVLATKLNLRKDIIRDIENGKHPKDNQLINKIKKFLNQYVVPSKLTPIISTKSTPIVSDKTI